MFAMRPFLDWLRFYAMLVRIVYMHVARIVQHSRRPTCWTNNNNFREVNRYIDRLISRRFAVDVAVHLQRCMSEKRYTHRALTVFLNCLMSERNCSYSPSPWFCRPFVLRQSSGCVSGNPASFFVSTELYYYILCLCFLPRMTAYSATTTAYSTVFHQGSLQRLP